MKILFVLDAKTFIIISMEGIWSTNRYILLTLSFIFPDGIGQKIFNHIKEIEFEDARKEHQMDCSLYRIMNKLGPDFMNYIPDWGILYPIQYKRSFLYQTLKHVDFGFYNLLLFRDFHRSLPILRNIQKIEVRYPEINSINENDIPIKHSWIAEGCMSSIILNNILKKKITSYSEIRFYNPLAWERIKSQGNSFEYNYYDGFLDIPVQKCTEHIPKKNIIRKIKKTLHWKKMRINEWPEEESIITMKYEQRIKRKYKKNESYLFNNKRNHLKNRKNIRTRNYGISSK